jgi:uncharacterized protein (DUF58 family)
MEQKAADKLRASKIKLISTLKLMNIFPGDWESIFKGEGMEYDSTRPYEAGDNPKDLDLFTLAQSGEEDIIMRAEERQMKIYIWLDISGSMRSFEEMFFPAKSGIKDIALGLIAYSTANVYTPLGLCAFDSNIKNFFPAKTGLDYCDEMIDWVFEQDIEDSVSPTDIHKAVSFLLERAEDHNIIFFISDFKEQSSGNDITSLMKPVVDKYDFIPVIIRDPIEKNGYIKSPISIEVKNIEGRGTAEFYLTQEKMQEIKEISENHLLNILWGFRKLGVDCLVLDSLSIDHCYNTLAGFFEKRKRVRV